MNKEQGPDEQGRGIQEYRTRNKEQTNKEGEYRNIEQGTDEQGRGIQEYRTRNTEQGISK